MRDSRRRPVTHAEYKDIRHTVFLAAVLVGEAVFGAGGAVWLAIMVGAAFFLIFLTAVKAGVRRRAPKPVHTPWPDHETRRGTP